jgi:hypothetical protein
LRLCGGAQADASKHQTGGKYRGQPSLLFFNQLKTICAFFHFISCARNAGGLILISDFHSAAAATQPSLFHLDPIYMPDRAKIFHFHRWSLRHRWFDFAFSSPVFGLYNTTSRHQRILSTKSPRSGVLSLLY